MYCTCGNICPTEAKLASVNLEKPKDRRWRQVAMNPQKIQTQVWEQAGRNELYVNAAVRKGVTVRYDRHRRLLVRAARGACRRASKELATYRLRESKGSGLADCSQRRVSWKGFATASDGATIATGDCHGRQRRPTGRRGGCVWWGGGPSPEFNSKQ